MRAHDWGAHLLGPPAAWPQALRAAVSILLRSKYPMILTWGPEFVMLYNDAYVPTLGEKHPGALGELLPEQFQEIWGAIGPMQQAVLAGGEATWDEDLPLVIERGRGPEETFFTFSYSAVPDEDRPGGVLAVLSITTPEVLAGRRLALLNDIGSVVTDDLAAAGEALSKVFEDHRAEIPGGRLWGTSSAVATLLAEFGTPGPEDASPSPVTDLHDDGPLDRVCLDVGAGTASGLLEVWLSPLRPLDVAHRRFLSQLSQQVGQVLDLAAARASEASRLQALVALDEAKTQFLATMSHELRTPLTLLLGPVGDVASGRRESLGREDAVRLQQQGRRLLGLVDDLLEVARSESGRLAPRPEPVDVGRLSQDVASPLLEAARYAGLDVREQWPSGVVCLMDRGLWENVVANLVGNALKYTLTGSLEVELRAEGPDLVLVVRDTGVGIDLEDQPRVFERFRRARTGEGRTFEGAGVGLAIVSDSVAALGGSVRLTSAPGVGTEVVVRVPDVRVSDVPVVDSAPSAKRITAVLAQAELLVPRAGSTASVEVPSDVGLTSGGARPLLLVVDDNAAMREYVAQCLSDVGSVVVAADGLQALEALERWPIDLVVSDVMMPRLDGESLLVRIREHPASADLPVQLLSARAESTAVVDGLARGADDYVAKPFSREELVARVRAHLELAELRREAQRRRDRDVLLAGVSHELQTPLARILSGVSVLGQRDLAEDVRAVVEVVRTSSEDLRMLVAELLDRGDLVTGEPLRPRLQEVDLVPLLEAWCAASTLDVTVAASSSCYALVDPFRTRRILAVLLDRAAASGARAVRVSASTESGQVHVRVCDDGRVITHEEAERLFSPGDGGRSAPGRNGPLFVSRRSALAMGGDLVLTEPSTAAGNAFDLTVPGGSR